MQLSEEFQEFQELLKDAFSMWRYEYVLESEIEHFKVPDGWIIACVSNIGTPKDTLRVSLLDSSKVPAFKEPVEGVDFINKHELEPGDESGGIMVINPDTNVVLTWGDYHMDLPYGNPTRTGMKKRTLA